MAYFKLTHYAMVFLVITLLLYRKHRCVKPLTVAKKSTYMPALTTVVHTLLLHFSVTL